MTAVERPIVMTIRTITNRQAHAGATPEQTKTTGRYVAFDYLRAFAVTLVLFHHAILAYTVFASLNLENPIATATPVVNGQRWLGFDLIVAFNDTFLMALLFFVSGLFVWQSLTGKGPRNYLKGRLKRLGLPFVIGVFFLIPLAYYPARLEVGRITGTGVTYGEFWLGMIRSGFGTGGHLWFLWLLLAFNCLALLLYRFAPRHCDPVRGRLTALSGRPARFFGAVLGISIIVYPPMAILFGPLDWIGTGPFHAQTGRILLYLVYFSAGTAAGAWGLDRLASGSHGPLAKRWWGWLAVGLVAFMVFILLIAVVSDQDRTLVSEIAFAVNCGAMVFAITGLFLRYAKRRNGILDRLSENAYGIYIVHYVFIIWLQYALLESPLAPGMKAIVVFAGTLTLSFGVVAVIRRIPAVAKII